MSGVIAFHSHSAVNLYLHCPRHSPVNSLRRYPNCKSGGIDRATRCTQRF